MDGSAIAPGSVGETKKEIQNAVDDNRVKDTPQNCFEHDTSSFLVTSIHAR